MKPGRLFTAATQLLTPAGKSTPIEQPNQNKEMKIADTNLLNLFMRGNEKCKIPQTP